MRDIAVDIAAGVTAPGRDAVLASPKWPEYARVVAAALLLVCLVPPFSSCSYAVDEDGVLTALSEKPAAELRKTYHYPWKLISRDQEWVILLAIAWPAAVLAFWRRARHRWERRSILTLEPVLFVSAAAYIGFASDFLATPEIGARLMLLAYGIYAVAWLSDVIVILRTRLRRRFHAGGVA